MFLRLSLITCRLETSRGTQELLGFRIILELHNIISGMTEELKLCL